VLVGHLLLPKIETETEMMMMKPLEGEEYREEGN